MEMKYLKLLLAGLLISILLISAANAQYFELKAAQNYGGKQQLNDFIAEEMVYPEKALKEKIEGTVLIKCLVTKDGKTENVNISQPVNPGLDAEALRIFSFLLWEPSVMRGVEIDEEVIVAIEFRVKKYQRVVNKRGYGKIEYPHEPVDESMIIYKTSQLTTSPKPTYEKPGMRFTDFVGKNLVYPPAAYRQGISGTVELFFVVEPSGRLSNIRIIKGVGGGCNEEAIRLLKMLKWSPGILNGKAVRTEMTLTLTFNLSNYENLQYVPASNTNQF
jgi:TonB family protein